MVDWSSVFQDQCEYGTLQYCNYNIRLNSIRNI